MDIGSLISEFVVFVLQALLAWFVVSLIIGLSRQKKAQERKITEEAVALASKMIHQIKEEEHGGVSYWFDRETDEFLGQGKTLDEMRAHLKSRFKGHIFVLPNGLAMAGPDMDLMKAEDLAKSLG